MARRPKAQAAQRWPLSDGPVARALVWPCVLLIRLYQVTLSPLVGRHCRFEPTCSHYGVEAYRAHGILGGTYLTARRILRCHPLGPAGLDPVPSRRGSAGGSAVWEPVPEAPDRRNGARSGASEDRPGAK